ncbi:hypothetical protein LTR94_037947, partial [Friedmanniomyces endolithicus]
PVAVRRAILSRRDPVHHLRSGSGVPVSVGGQRLHAGLDRVDQHDDLHCRAGARPGVCVEEGSAGMGV